MTNNTPPEVVAQARMLLAEFAQNGPSRAYEAPPVVEALLQHIEALQQRADAADAACVTLREQVERTWRCFHCGETFTTVGAARDHFGETPSATAGCLIDRVALEEGGKPERGRGLLIALRKIEAERDALKAELATLREALEDWRVRAHASEKALVTATEEIATLREAQARSQELVRQYEAYGAKDGVDAEERLAALVSQVQALIEKWRNANRANLSPDQDATYAMGLLDAIHKAADELAALLPAIDSKESNA